jgi:hypothetical protein
MTSSPSSQKAWFEQGEPAARIAQYRDLQSRSEGSWYFIRDNSGVEGVMIADGAVWFFGCSGCPEMITSGPISPGDFLADKLPGITTRKVTAASARNFSDLNTLACRKLLELGYPAS